MVTIKVVGVFLFRMHGLCMGFGTCTEDGVWVVVSLPCSFLYCISLEGWRKDGRAGDKPQRVGFYLFYRQHMTHSLNRMKDCMFACEIICIHEARLS